MAILKNHKNIQSPQRFNPPTQFEDATNGGYCYVYDPATWRNKNRTRSENPPEAMGGPKPKAVSFGAPRKDNSFDNPIPGRV